jgi:hypothetical protein
MKDDELIARFKLAFFCNTLGWHKRPIMEPDCCSRCGCPVLQDSQGNWFSIGEKPNE